MTSAWRPASGTEGEMFAASRCNLCINNRWDHATGTGVSCPIWMNALAEVDDFHLYWDVDTGHGKCDMFYPKSEARAAGLDAAREAVAALDVGRDVRFSVDVQADALAAIDALREGP